MKKIVYLLVTLLIVMFGCNSKIIANESKVVELKLLIDSVEVEVDWEQNDSVRQLMELAKNSDIVINANRYGGFEQVGNIGHSIKNNNQQMTTAPGDIVLYNSSNVVVFFGSNSWSYTKLGKIKNKTQNDLEQLLDKHNVVITLKNVKSGTLVEKNIATFETKNEKVAFDLVNKKVKLNSGYYMPTNGLGTWSLYSDTAFDEVMSYASITPSVIQNENHIYYQNTDLRDYVGKYGVIIESYFPFGGRGNTKDSLDNDVIVSLARKYNKTAAQIILRWNLQSNYIAIPGSSNENHIKENNDIYDFILSDDDMKKITNINKYQRYANW